MSAISGYGDNYSAYDYQEPSDPPPPGSDNPVENASPPPQPEPSSGTQEDASQKDYAGRVTGTIIGHITQGNFHDATVLTDID
jgi:hypothetical protein